MPHRADPIKHLKRLELGDGDEEIDRATSLLFDLLDSSGLVAARYGHEAIIFVAADASPIELRASADAFDRLVGRCVEEQSRQTAGRRIQVSWSTSPDDRWLVIEAQNEPL